nr:Gag-Pol polyprotein [Tanacetum cinerariifolium]
MACDISWKSSLSKLIDEDVLLKPQVDFVVQLVLWIVDSGCSKHMTGDLQLLRNFIEKFMGNASGMIISLYNLFLIGQFCNGDLEVAFHSYTCHAWNLEGDDLLTKPVATESKTPALNENADEIIQEAIAGFEGNGFYNPLHTPMFEEVESCSTYQDPSNMHEFHETYRSTNKWTKNHKIKQVIVSTTKPKNIKEVMLDHSWIDTVQDELNQFKRLDVWELVECPIGKNIISIKWIWKTKTDAKNTII